MSGVKIRLESTHYLLRTMEAADAALDWGRWLANPATARMLNAKPRTLSEDERRAYIERFDSRTSHLLGIWDRETEAFVGFWSVYVDERSKEFLINVLVGSNEHRHQGALKETRYHIYRHFFDTLGLNAVRCTVVGSNKKMIAFITENRWIEIGITRGPALDGTGMINIHQFRLGREVWEERREEIKGGA